MRFGSGGWPGSVRYFTSDLDSSKGVQMEDGPLEGAITWTFGMTPRPMMPWFQLSTPTAHAPTALSASSHRATNQPVCCRKREWARGMPYSISGDDKPSHLSRSVSVRLWHSQFQRYWRGRRRPVVCIYIVSQESHDFLSPPQMLSCKSNGNIQIFRQNGPNLSECNQQNARPAIFQMAIDWVSWRMATFIRHGNACQRLHRFSGHIFTV